jgi:Sulfotransferase family
MTAARGVIVFGHPRSGTSLLQRLLSSHPEISAPPETFVFHSAGRFLSSDIAGQGNDIGVLAGLSFLGFSAEDVTARLAELCFGFLTEHAEREGKSVWVEKTAFNSFFIKEISDLVGDKVRFIGIVRHPLDVAISTIEFCEKIGMYPEDLHKYIVRHSSPMEAFLASWKDVNTDLITLGKEREEQTFVVRYEDLVQSTEEVLEAMLGFLDVDDSTDFLPNALSGMSIPGFHDHKAYRSSAVYTSQVNRWRKYPNVQISRLAHSVEAEARLFGYELPKSEDVSLESARRLYLQGLGFGSPAK